MAWHRTHWIDVQSRCVNIANIRIWRDVPIDISVLRVRLGDAIRDVFCYSDDSRLNIHLHGDKFEQWEVGDNQIVDEVGSPLEISPDTNTNDRDIYGGEFIMKLLADNI